MRASSRAVFRKRSSRRAGLVIAIPVMVIHGFLSEKIEKVMSELYIQSTVSLNKIFPGSRG